MIDHRRSDRCSNIRLPLFTIAGSIVRFLLERFSARITCNHGDCQLSSLNSCSGHLNPSTAVESATSTFHLIPPGPSFFVCWLVIKGQFGPLWYVPRCIEYQKLLSSILHWKIGHVSQISTLVTIITLLTFPRGLLHVDCTMIFGLQEWLHQGTNMNSLKDKV